MNTPRLSPHPALFALLALAAAAGSSAQAAPPIPGALLAGGAFPNRMAQYSKAGAQLDQFAVTGMNAALSGVAYIGGTVYASDIDTFSIGTLDMSTGAFTSLFPSGNTTGLGNIGGDLLDLQLDGTVNRRTTAGVILSSFTASAGDGIDSDGTNIYVATTDATVETYSATGTFLGSFSTSLPDFSLFSLAYDPDAGTLWVGGSENGTAFLRNYTTGGTLLGGFNTSDGLAVGLDVVPGASVAPEPGAGLLALAALPFAARRLRPRSRK